MRTHAIASSGWIHVRADSQDEAERRSYNLLDAGLYPVLDNADAGDWEIISVAEAEPIEPPDEDKQ